MILYISNKHRLLKLFKVYFIYRLIFYERQNILISFLKGWDKIYRSEIIYELSIISCILVLCHLNYIAII